MGFKRYMACIAVSMAAVACFDDTELWYKFEDVDRELAELSSRIDSLEQKMADNVAAIQSVISVGSIASWTYNAETGKGLITLLDGNVITIDQTIKGYSLITVEKGDDGAYYWAICYDGVNLPLKIDNKRVPVAVTPALKISEDNEWMISVDGGATWVKTGISYFTGEGADENEGEEETPVTEVSVFEKAEKDGDYLILTLAGGTEVKVTVVGEAVFKASVDTLWFSRGKMQKAVALEMQNVKAFTITEKPDGWKANSDDEYLFVTSPDNFNGCPSEGKVKALAVFDNGASPEILQVAVAYESMFSVTAANEVVSVKLSRHTGDDFTGYLFYSSLKSAYDPAAAVEWLNANPEELKVCTGSAKYALEEIIPDYNVTMEYVVAVVPFLPPAQLTAGNMAYEEADIVAIETIAATNPWEIKNLRYDYADLSAIMSVPEYYGGFLKKEVWDTRGKTDIMELLEDGNLTPVTNVVYNGPASAFPEGTESSPLTPATEYVVWYLPVNESGVYSEDMFIENPFTTPDVKADASVAVPDYVLTDVTSGGFSATVTPAASYYKTYAAIVSAASLPETDIDLVRYIITLNQYSEGSALLKVSKYSFSPDDEVYLLAVSVTAEGGYGAIVKRKVELAQLIYTDALGVTVLGYECNEEGDVLFDLEFTGDPVSMTYLAASYVYATDAQLQEQLALEQNGNAVTVPVSSLSNGLLLTGLQSGVEYTLYSVVTDSEGKKSYMTKSVFTPVISIDYILSTDADYEYGMPVISGNLASKKYTMNVEMPSECQKYWLFCGDPEYLPGDVYAQSDKMINMGLELSGETVHTESITNKVYSNVASYTRIYMVWQDINGRYHAIYEFNPNAK